MDNARVRGLYPALASRTTFLDAAGGALPPEVVMRAMTTAIRRSLTAPGAIFARSRHVSQLEDHARLAIADLTGAAAGDVLLGADGLDIEGGFKW